jgi:predicted transcriptional regulator
MARRKEGWKVLSVEAPIELVERMKAIAERNHRSLSGEAVAAMERYVAAEEAARPTEPTAKKNKGGAR